jgi:hypothetical protein
MAVASLVMKVSWVAPAFVPPPRSRRVSILRERVRCTLDGKCGCYARQYSPIQDRKPSASDARQPGCRGKHFAAYDFLPQETGFHPLESFLLLRLGLFRL